MPTPGIQGDTQPSAPRFGHRDGALCYGSGFFARIIKRGKSWAVRIVRNDGLLASDKGFGPLADARRVADADNP